MNTCNITTKLYELRIAKGVTQGEVASALSVSNKTISKWENGTSSPDLSMLVSLAKYYDVSTDTLLGLEDKRKGTKQVIADESEVLTDVKPHSKYLKSSRKCFLHVLTLRAREMIVFAMIWTLSRLKQIVCQDIKSLCTSYSTSPFARTM